MEHRTRLELARRGWGQWRDAVREATAGRRGWGPVEAATVLAGTITSLPVFCDLLAHTAMSLENDVGLERARRYKNSATAAHDALVRALEDASTMTSAQTLTLVATTVALTAGFWQLAHPVPTLAKLYEQEPAWAHAALDFEPRLTLILRATALGLTELLPSAS